MAVDLRGGRGHHGAFGAGKTTTADLVTKRLEDAKVFDPECVGYMLMPFVMSPTGDFQDVPLWRHLVIHTMTGLAQQHPHTWVPPMSLINSSYRTEILDGIRAATEQVRMIASRSVRTYLADCRSTP